MSETIQAWPETHRTFSMGDNVRKVRGSQWRAMLYAPRDGSKVELLIEHRTWWTAHKCSPDESRIWRAVCEGQWIDHNGGGWTWAGMSGTPIGWRPLKPANAKLT